MADQEPRQMLPDVQKYFEAMEAALAAIERASRRGFNRSEKRAVSKALDALVEATLTAAQAPAAA